MCALAQQQWLALLATQYDSPWPPAVARPRPRPTNLPATSRLSHVPGRHLCDVGFELLRTTYVWMLSSPSSSSCSPAIHSNWQWQLPTNDDHCCPACTTHSRCHGRYHCSSTPCNVESCPVRLLGSLALLLLSSLQVQVRQVPPPRPSFASFVSPGLAGLVSSCLALLAAIDHYLPLPIHRVRVC